MEKLPCPSLGSVLRQDSGDLQLGLVGDAGHLLLDEQRVLVLAPGAGLLDSPPCPAHQGRQGRHAQAQEDRVPEAFSTGRANNADCGASVNQLALVTTSPGQVVVPEGAHGRLWSPRQQVHGRRSGLADVGVVTLEAQPDEEDAFGPAAPSETKTHVLIHYGKPVVARVGGQYRGSEGVGGRFEHPDGSGRD